MPARTRRWRPSRSCWARRSARTASCISSPISAPASGPKPCALQKELLALERPGRSRAADPCVDAAGPTWPSRRCGRCPGTRAAGVPLFMEVTVTNYGADPARDVALSAGRRRPAARRRSHRGDRPGRSESRRFYVNFPTAGEHRVAARLASDAVEADNARYAVIDFPIGVPVLIVDGDASAQDGYFLARRCNPGMVRTGIAPQIELPRYLNHNPLDKFQTIYCLQRRSARSARRRGAGELRPLRRRRGVLRRRADATAASSTSSFIERRRVVPRAAGAAAGPDRQPPGEGGRPGRGRPSAVPHLRRRAQSVPERREHRALLRRAGRLAAAGRFAR